MAAAVKFIHCADLHLGSAFLGLGRDLPELAGRLAEAPFAAFARIVDLALREEVDFLVIAGDIFDRDNPSLSGRMRFREELLRLDAAKIPVFLSGGNHDPVPAAWPPAVSLPGNARLFSADTVEFFPVERNGEVIARVGGLSHSRLRQTDNLVERFAAPPGGPFTVGVLHANVGAQPGFQPYAPAAVADLVGRGVDYWALGHVHNFRKVNEAAPAAYYPGCPQGRAVNEPGERGCLLVQVDSAGRLSVDFRAVEAMRFEVLEIAGLADIESFDELAGRCRQGAEKLRGNAPLLIRLRLSGPTPLNAELRRSDPAELAALLGAALPPEATLERLELATTGLHTEIDTDSLAAEVATSAAELREEEALERELAVLRSKCPGVPEFTRDELESIRRDAVERILDLLAGTMEARP